MIGAFIARSVAIMGASEMLRTQKVIIDRKQKGCYGTTGVMEIPDRYCRACSSYNVCKHQAVEQCYALNKTGDCPFPYRDCRVRPACMMAKTINESEGCISFTTEEIDAILNDITDYVKRRLLKYE